MLKFPVSSRADELVRHVEEQIDERLLSPGDRIGTKKELQVQSGMARATVNEAVKLLRDRGRVVLRPGPGGGIFVSPSDPNVQLGRLLLTVGDHASTIAEALTVRNYLETLLVEEATRHRTDADVEALQACVGRMRESYDSPERFIASNWDLHERIALITPNAVLKTLYLGLMKYVRSNVVDVTSGETHTRDYKDTRVRAHEGLVSVIARGDVTQVAAAIEAHRLPE